MQLNFMLPMQQSYVTLWTLSRNNFFRFVSHLLYLIPKIPYGIHLAPTSPYELMLSIGYGKIN